MSSKNSTTVSAEAEAAPTVTVTEQEQPGFFRTKVLPGAKAGAIGAGKVVVIAAIAAAMVVGYNHFGGDA